MPDRDDEQVKKLRSVEVPDQWDDIISRASAGPVDDLTDVSDESSDARWILLVATAAVVILIAGSVAILRRSDHDVIETSPSASTTEPQDQPDDRSAPPGPEALPRPQYSSCTGVLAGPGDGSGVGGHLKLPAGGQRVPNDGH